MGMYDRKSVIIAILMDDVRFEQVCTLCPIYCLYLSVTVVRALHRFHHHPCRNFQLLNPEVESGPCNQLLAHYNMDTLNPAVTLR